MEARHFPRALALGLLLLPSLRAADAFRELSHVDAFAFGGIGVAGTPSAGEAAFRKILASPNAPAEFQRLLAQGNPPARCYALAALHALDRTTYEAAAARFAKSDTPVKTIAGCLAGTLPMSSVAAAIATGQYDRAIARSPEKK